MGICASQNQAGDSPGDSLKSPPNWKSKPPMTEEQLKKKREEFWDTQPAYGGNEIVWQNLKAIVEESDLEMKQTIITSCGLILPQNTLAEEVYDETGYKYDLPDYILSDPSNLVKSS